MEGKLQRAPDPSSAEVILRHSPGRVFSEPSNCQRSSICLPEIIVQSNTCLYNFLHCVNFHLNCSTKDPPSCRKDPKAVLNYSPCSRQTIIEYNLLLFNILPWIGRQQPGFKHKDFITYQEIGNKR